MVHDSRPTFALLSARVGCAENNKLGSDLTGRLQEINQRHVGLDDSFTPQGAHPEREITGHKRLICFFERKLQSAKSAPIRVKVTSFK